MPREPHRNGENASKAGAEAAAGGGDPGGGTLYETVLAFEAAHRRRSPDGMRACFHEDALIESIASEGEPLDADATAEALRVALADGVYEIGDWHYEEMAPDVILSWT